MISHRAKLRNRGLQGSRSEPDTFEKLQGSTVEEDWRRVKALERVCRSVQGIMTAEALKLDVERETITYARLRNPRSILERRDDTADRLREVGGILAKLHSLPFDGGEFLFANDPYPLESFGLCKSENDLLQNAVPTGWFHADCWHGNFLRHGNNEAIALIDPLPDGYTIRRGFIRACGAIDLAVMHMGLFLCHPMKEQITFDVASAVMWADALLDGYLHNFGAIDERVRKSVLHLSRRLAVNHLASYHGRLAAPIAVIKKHIGRRIVNSLDTKIGWMLQ